MTNVQTQQRYQTGEVYGKDINGNARVIGNDGSVTVVTGTRIEGFPDGTKIKHCVERKGKTAGFSKSYWRVNIPAGTDGLGDNLVAAKMCGTAVFYDPSQTYLLPNESKTNLLDTTITLKTTNIEQFLSQLDKVYQGIRTDEGQITEFVRTIEQQVEQCAKYLAMTGIERQTLDLDTGAKKLTEWKRIEAVRRTRRVLEQIL